MTREEVEPHEHDILKKISEAINSGDNELETQLLNELPMEPSVAYAIRQVWGMEALQGYNLELAKLVYGENTFK